MLTALLAFNGLIVATFVIKSLRIAANGKDGAEGCVAAFGAMFFLAASASNVYFAFAINK